MLQHCITAYVFMVFIRCHVDTHTPASLTDGKPISTDTLLSYCFGGFQVDRFCFNLLGHSLCVRVCVCVCVFGGLCVA